MRHLRNMVLAGALAISLAAIAPSADANTVVLTQTPGAVVDGLAGFSGGFTGRFDLSPYLSDGQGRTFAVTSASLSSQAHSDPRYSSTTTVDDVISGFPTADFPNRRLIVNMTRTTTTTHTDNFADNLILGIGGFVPSQTATGHATQGLDTTDTQDLGFTDENGPAIAGFPTINHVHTLVVNTYHALYGDLGLSFDLNSDNLMLLNRLGYLNFGLSAASIQPYSGPSLPWDFNRPKFDNPILDGSSFVLDGVSLSFDVLQTGGPPLGMGGGVPEPGTWVLMLAGFGLAGAALRARRRHCHLIEEVNTVWSNGRRPR